MSYTNSCCDILKKRKKRSRKKQKLWFKALLSQRNERGIYNNLIQELRHEDIDGYKRFLKMTPEVFDDLLSYIETDITKQTRVLREPIPAKMKLAGNSLLFIYWIESHLQHIFCVHRSATGQFKKH